MYIYYVYKCIFALYNITWYLAWLAPSRAILHPEARMVSQDSQSVLELWKAWWNFLNAYPLGNRFAYQIVGK